jgi:hypothetical protein
MPPDSLEIRRSDCTLSGYGTPRDERGSHSDLNAGVDDAQPPS